LSKPYPIETAEAHIPEIARVRTIDAPDQSFEEAIPDAHTQINSSNYDARTNTITHTKQELKF
jgi:hypothetical protein